MDLCSCWPLGATAGGASLVWLSTHVAGLLYIVLRRIAAGSVLCPLIVVMATGDMFLHTCSKAQT